MQSWVVDGYVTFECHAPAWVTAHGHTCAAGHEHIGLQAAHEMGIVYATEDEAPALAGAGLTVLLMDGHAFLG